MTDAITKAWIRNESDERAAAAGYRFDPARAAYVVWWIENYCRLYEGEWAGEPMILRGCHEDLEGLPVTLPWDDGGKEESLLRAEIYAERFAAGEPVDWQYECTMRVFGWVGYSERWKREVRRFRKAATFVPKKSKKSPTLSGWGLYLLAGDGEQGQKVFIAAKDGSQARDIAGQHAVEMVNQSDDLKAVCKINMNEMRITHLPSRSFMKPLSSNDSRSQQAKEGLNGSLLVDELHVVDREFMNRVKRLGISRSEPLVAMFSTAGNDPEGYGKEQFDYGQDVINGLREDHQYFAAIYAAPQEMTDADLEADPVKYGKIANPAWGHTIGEEEYLADYRESNITTINLADFKMYRLNVWQTSSHPWKIAQRWWANRSDRTLASFRDEPCWIGADLSRARDMSAVVLTFRDDSGDRPEYYQFAWAWMVREYAEKHRMKAPFLDWEAEGLIEFCDDTIDMRQIEAVIVELSQAHYCREFRHDPAYANELARRLEEDHGIIAVPFRQTVIQYAKPTDDFEACVIDGSLHHDGNPVYAWEMGHAKIKSDTNNNRRIVKPTDDDYRKVDIVQSGIMSLSGAIASEAANSVYATSKPFFAGDED